MKPCDDTFIKSVINVNIADLWSRSKNLRQHLMNAVLVIEIASWWTSRKCPPVIFVHMNFTLIVKHSLKHPTLTLNICHSAVEQSCCAHLGILSKLCMIWEHSLMSQFSRIKNHWFTSRSIDAPLPPWRWRPLNIDVTGETSRTFGEK